MELPFRPVWFYLTTLTLLTLTTTGTPSLTNITLGGLFSLGGSGSDWDGTAILKAAEMALMHVNSDPDVLPDYFLNIDTKNSKCRPGDGMKGFFELLYEEPTKMMILGASCSVVSQPVAETSQHWNMVQVSSSSASDALSFRGRFPYFFRTNPAQSGLNAPRIAIMKEFGWKRIAVIHDNNEYFTTAINKFSEDLAVHNLTLVAKESFNAGETPTVQLRNIKEKDARIILASAYEDGLQQVFCEAYHMGMYGSKYIWMLESWNSVDWWKNVTFGCTEEEMYAVAQNYVGTVFLDLREDNNYTVSGLNARQYTAVYTDFTDGLAYAGLEFAPFGYDAVWAVALALHSVAKQLASENSSVRIEDFDYDNTHHLRERLVEGLSKLEFEGISGSVSFDVSGNRVAPFKIEQLIDGVEETVAIYLEDGGLKWTREDRLLFNGGATPRDGPLREIVHLGISPSTFIVFTSFAVLGIIMTVAFLIFNISFRSKRVVKLSCPSINNVIAIGCCMCYLDVILAGLERGQVGRDTVEYLCLAHAWILPISFTLAFGGLFAKTWRVHVIFRNKTRRTKIFNYHLFMVVGALVVVDVIIVSVWTACDPIQLVQVTLADQVDLVADKIIVRTLDKCDSPNSPKLLWSGIMFGYKGTLLMYGAFLAWETRKVTMLQLNDSKFIAIAIYNVAIPSVIITPLVLLLDIERPNVTFTLTAACITFGTTITNCLIFLPKIIAVWSESQSDGSQDQRIFTTHNQIAPQRPGTTLNLDVAKLRDKDREIVKLKHQLEEKATRIGELLELVQHFQLQLKLCSEKS